MVGRGQAFNKPGDDRLHNQKLPSGHIKVTIEVVVESDAPLPVPIDHAELMVVGDAIGTFVAWPINLIEIGGVECQKVNYLLYIFLEKRCAKLLIYYAHYFSI